MGTFDFMAGQKREPTWDEVQRRRALAEALAGSVGRPTTFGEGLSSLGAALGGVMASRKAGRMEAERAAIADQVFESALNGVPQDNSPLAEALGGSFAAPVSNTSPLAEALAPAPPEPLFGITPGAAAGAAGAYGGIRSSLSGTESGGRLSALNNEVGAGGVRGHGGRLQFGDARLAEAAAAGIVPRMSPQAFAKQSDAIQSAVEDWHFADIDADARRMGLDRYYGQTVGGVTITPDAVRAMAHLGGIGGAAKFLNSGGKHNPADSFGTSLRDYAMKHGAASGGSPAAPAAAASPGFAPINIPAPAPVNVAMIRAMSNPYLSPEQKQILGGIMAQQQAAQITPYQAAQLQMAQQQMGWEQKKYGMEQQAAVAQAAAQAAKPIEINGQLIDPQTRQVIGDYRTPETPSQPASVQEYQFYAQQTQARGEQPMPYEQFSIEKARAGASSVSVNTGGGPELGKLSTDFGYIMDPATGLPVIDPATGLPTAAPVPGSPAALEAAKAAQAGVVKEGNKAVSTEVITSAANKARQAAQGRALGGFGQGMAAGLPWTDSAEVARQVEVLKSNAKVENLQAMRAASPTGGALGAVSDSENAMLAAKAGALDPSSPTFARDLDDYERTLLRIVHGPEAGDQIYQQTRQGGGASSSDDDLIRKYGG